MLAACQRVFPQCDGLIGVAAPCDYRPIHVEPQKIKKTGDPLVLLVHLQVAASTSPCSTTVGKPEIAVLNAATQNIGLFQASFDNTFDGTFTELRGSPVATDVNPVAFAVGDLNADGFSDLAIANQSANDALDLNAFRSLDKDRFELWIRRLESNEVRFAIELFHRISRRTTGSLRPHRIFACVRSPGPRCLRRVIRVQNDSCFGAPICGEDIREQSEEWIDVLRGAQLLMEIDRGPKVARPSAVDCEAVAMI
jgi:hypothetical protein